MRLLYFIRIGEFETAFCGVKAPNRLICTVFASFGLFVTLVSFMQHAYSYYMYKNVFHCRSILQANATIGEQFLAYDIVIFDFGLMHRILGTTECVANYLDGGYMRCSWCVEQALSLTLLLACLCCIPRPVWLLWPALFMQSSYVLGMAILSMAIAPKMMDAFSRGLDQELGIAFVAYFSGVAFNWLFTFILWHYYWGMEKRQTDLRERDSIEC